MQTACSRPQTHRWPGRHCRRERSLNSLELRSNAGFLPIPRLAARSGHDPLLDMARLRHPSALYQAHVLQERTTPPPQSSITTPTLLLGCMIAGKCFVGKEHTNKPTRKQQGPLPPPRPSRSENKKLHAKANRRPPAYQPPPAITHVAPG